MRLVECVENEVWILILLPDSQQMYMQVREMTTYHTSLEL